MKDCINFSHFPDYFDQSPTVDALEVQSVLPTCTTSDLHDLILMQLFLLPEIFVPTYQLMPDLFLSQ